MGLDMYAYVAARAGQYNEFYDTAELDNETKDFVSKTVTKPREIAYWRKHPNLHGWMERLWEHKMNAAGQDNPHRFNGIELELTWQDLDQLEQDVRAGHLPVTAGFFFGDPADDYYREQDLDFVRDARAELFSGLRVFYNSSW